MFSRGGSLNPVPLAVLGTVVQAIAEIGKEAAKDPTSGAAATTGAAVTFAAGAAWGPLGALAGALAGHEINRLAARIDRTFEQQAATNALLSNQHLSRALAGAIKQRLKLVASGTYSPGVDFAFLGSGPLPNGRDLVAIADRALDWWPALVESGVDATRNVDERVITERIAEELSGRDANAPSATDWRQVLEFAHGYIGGRGQLDELLTDTAANALAEHFMHDAVMALASDSATSGEAFASAVLRFLSSELFAIRELSGKVDQSLAVTRELKEAMSAGAHASRLLHCDDLQPVFEEQLVHLDARLDAISKEIGDVGVGVKSIAARLDSRSTDIKDGFERLEQTVRGAIEPRTQTMRRSATAAVVVLLVAGGAVAYWTFSKARSLDRDYRRLGWVTFVASSPASDDPVISVRAQLWLAAEGVRFDEVRLTAIAHERDGRMSPVKLAATMPAGERVAFIDFPVRRGIDRLTACLAVPNAGLHERSRVTQTFSMETIGLVVPVSLTPVAAPSVSSESDEPCRPATVSGRP